MEIVQVKGNLVSTIKHDVYNGTKLLLVETLNAHLEPTGNITVAVDSVDAGIGDVVLMAREGKAAGDIIGKPKTPVRSIIVGVIDKINCEQSNQE